MPNQPPKRKISPLAIIAVILILLALGMLFLIFAPGPRMRWALSMGEKYLTECEYTQAVTMFSRAIRVDDRMETAYVGRAEAYIQLNRPAAAVDDLTFVIDELTTDDADVYIQRAEAYTMLGDYDAAQADLTAAASLGADTTEAEARLNEAAATDEAGNTPDAETPAATKIVSLPIQRTTYSTIVSSLEPSDTTITTTETMQFDDEGYLASYNSNNRTIQMDDHGEIVLDDQNGYRRQMTNTYDENGNLVSQDITDSTGQYQNRYTYDDHGNFISYVTDGPSMAWSDYVPSMVYSYSYDDQGRITHFTRGITADNVIAVKDYTYTADSYTVVTTYPPSTDRTVNTYTLNGVPISSQQYRQTQSGVEYLSSETTYNADGNVLTVHGYDGNSTLMSITENTYDEKGRIMQSREVSYYGQGSETVTSYAYTYDADGNVIGRTATTDGKVTEETTYIVQEVSSDYDVYYTDYSFDSGNIRHPSVYLYGSYVVLN